MGCAKLAAIMSITALIILTGCGTTPGQSTTSQPPSINTPQVSLNAGPEPMVALARADLAQKTGKSQSNIRLTSVTEKEFPDTSLGRPQPGVTYVQVITPGYVIVLETGTRRFEYHTDQKERVVLCDPVAGVPIESNVSPADAVPTVTVNGSTPPASTNSATQGITTAPETTPPANSPTIATTVPGDLPTPPPPITGPLPIDTTRITPPPQD